MKILITGSEGFVAKNLRIRLAEQGYSDVLCFNRNHSLVELADMAVKADFVFHLAGVNRPKNDHEFISGNADLTQALVDALLQTNRTVPVVLSSSIQADRDNPYGESKAAAEEITLDYMRASGSPAYVYRLPNVFGKWCKPNYNSAVATFCHNIANNIPITVNDASGPLSLVYIDDVCDTFIGLLCGDSGGGRKDVTPVYNTTVGEVASLLHRFKESRESLVVENVGAGIERALYSTYLSYIKPANFSYVVPGYSDPRGTFVEMLKTPTAGQLSFFTAHAGVTRGGHYHHSKNEKFLVIKGKARYRFKHIVTNEHYEIVTDAGEYRIVETMPGWSHDITNIGQGEMIVMLWANEIFDRAKPDTVASPLA